MFECYSLLDSPLFNCILLIYYFLFSFSTAIHILSSFTFHIVSRNRQIQVELDGTIVRRRRKMFRDGDGGEVKGGEVENSTVEEFQKKLKDGECEVARLR